MFWMWTSLWSDNESCLSEEKELEGQERAESCSYLELRGTSCSVLALDGIIFPTSAPRENRYDFPFYMWCLLPFIWFTFLDFLSRASGIKGLKQDFSV